ncbi:hypothetical protein [Geminicoccus flavidas]|uniref:hypothetical protein n=1 Tax=Geminicoccus flavidas TaxID=2506407 RepID=UPI001357AC2C|nr:hypothetical protein [Geminicoccus flavidas]
MNRSGPALAFGTSNALKGAEMLLTAKAAKHLDAVRLDQSPAGRINTLRLEWLEAQSQNFWAMGNLRRIPEGTERYEKAVERIVRRQAMMFSLVERSCLVPLDGPEARRQLQRFADWIEKAGSDHEDRDIELIEARLGEVIDGEYEVVQPHLLAAPTKKTGRGKGAIAAS